jgi:hypothetical protein
VLAAESVVQRDQGSLLLKLSFVGFYRLHGSDPGNRLQSGRFGEVVRRGMAQSLLEIFVPEMLSFGRTLTFKAKGDLSSCPRKYSNQRRCSGFIMAVLIRHTLIPSYIIPILLYLGWVLYYAKAFPELTCWIAVGHACVAVITVLEQPLAESLGYSSHRACISRQRSPPPLLLPVNTSFNALC